MTSGAWEIVGLDTRELPFGKTIGGALRDLIRMRWPHHTAKTLERRWGLDRKTAQNVVIESNVSERTLNKAARAEGWALWHALGVELFGESYYEYDQRRIEAILEGAQGGLSNIRRIRERTEAALASPGGGTADRAWPLAGELGGGEGGAWGEADPEGQGPFGRDEPPRLTGLQLPRSRDRGAR